MPNPQLYYTRREMPARTAGNVSGTALGDMPSPSGVFRAGLASQGVYEEIRRAGNMLTKFGLNALEENQKAEYYDQLTRNKLAYLQDDFNFQEWMAKNPDTSKWQGEFEERQKNFKSTLKISNKRASDDFELWAKERDIERLHYLNTKKLQTDAQNFADNFNASDKLYPALAVGAADDKTFNGYMTDWANLWGFQLKEEKLKALARGLPVDFADIESYESIPDWDNETLVGTAGERKAMFELRLIETNKQRQKVIRDITVETVRGHILSLIDNAVETGGDVKVAENAGYDYLREMKKQGVLTPSDIVTLNSNLNYYTSGKIRRDKEENAINITQTKHDLRQGVIEDKITDFKPIDDADLEDTKKEPLYEMLRRRASKNPDTDWSEYMKAENAVMMSLLRELPREDAEDVLAKGYRKNLNDDDFKRLWSRLDSDLPPEVLTQLKTVMNYNRDKANEYEFNYGMVSPAFPYFIAKEAGERLKFSPLEKEAAARANAKLFDWTAKRTKDGKPPTLEEMYNMAKGVSVPEANRFDIPRPETKEEYDKLKSGTEYIAPDGSRRRKK